MGGRILLSGPDGDEVEDNAVRVGDLGGTMADSFEIIGGEGQGALGLSM